MRAYLRPNRMRSRAPPCRFNVIIFTSTERSMCVTFYRAVVMFITCCISVLFILLFPSFKIPIEALRSLSVWFFPSFPEIKLLAVNSRQKFFPLRYVH
jgi:hypothetical protein